jgi:hypothetical protein
VNALQKLRDRLQPGAVLTCVANTLLPHRAGDTRIIERIHPTRADVIVQGEVREMGLPVRACDVEWLDGDTVCWSLQTNPPKQARLAGHTVTYRIRNEAP